MVEMNTLQNNMASAINNCLQGLPKQESKAFTGFDNYRKSDIERKLNIMGVTPLDVMITGVTGAGKSTTLNTIFNHRVASVGEGVDPETMDIKEYALNNLIRFWDTPGLGDGVNRDKKHKKKITDLLYKTYTNDGYLYGYIDMCVVVIEGSTRDLGTTYSLINQVLVPNIHSDRILVVINQADVAMKGRHWDFDKNEPDPVLSSFLEEKSQSMRKRVKEATGVLIPKPVCYSAKYNWNMEKVLDFIIDNIPKEKRKLL